MGLGVISKAAGPYVYISRGALEACGQGGDPFIDHPGKGEPQGTITLLSVWILQDSGSYEISDIPT